MTRRVRGTSLVLLLSIMLFFPLVFASSNNYNLLVQDIEINPNPARIGETVAIKFNIRNNEQNSTLCKVTLYCAECIIDTQEINIRARSEIPISFNLNTTTLNTGVYKIETLIEVPSGQQKIFNVGNIPIETESTNSDFFNWQLLLLAIPIGAVAFGLILIKSRKKKQNPIILDNQISENIAPMKPEQKIESLFDEILNEEERKIENEHISADEKEEKKKKKYAKVASARKILDS